jgi:hypothetical protein
LNTNTTQSYSERNNHHILEWAALLIFLALLSTSFFISGTGDDGDSIMHYLFAHYAPKHPVLYFHHWAKPVYVLLASAFAWAGFKGIVFFNICVTSASIYLTGRVSEKAQTGSGIYAMIFFLFCPLHFILIFSGLTEPLFGLFLILGIFLAYNLKKYNLSAIILSFLPLVRSEGLIFLCLFALLFIILKQYKAFLLLAFGHIAYSIAGWLSGLNFLWVITDIPYSSAHSSYGHGHIDHFIIQAFYVVGLPVYILLCLGIIYILTKRFFVHNLKHEYILPLILILFLAYFTAHTFAWYLGVYNSAGLKRVLVAIAPLTAIIAVHGLLLISGLLKGKASHMSKASIAAIVMIFFFAGTPASSLHRKDLMLTDSQHIADEAASFLSSEKLNSGHKFYCNYPYINYVLKIDPFDSSKYQFLNSAILKTLKKGDMIIWDDWYSPTEGGIKLEDVNKSANLKEINSFKTAKNEIVIFIAK